MRVVGARVGAVVVLLVTAVGCGSSTRPSPVAEPGCGRRHTTLERGPSVADVAVGPQPFGVALSPDGQHAFVALTDPGTIVVLDRTGTTWRVRRQEPLGTAAAGLAITSDGRRLLVATSSGVTVLDVAALLSGSVPAEVSHVVLATGAVQVAASPDGHTAAASEEQGAAVAVFDIASGTVAEVVSTDQGPVGLTFTSEQRLLVVSELRAGQPAPTSNDPEGLGSLQVIDRRAPGAWARTASVPAGCSPVRVVFDPRNRTAWVTARGSDALLAFATSERKPTLRAWIPVGPSPVGVALAGDTVVVADSDRFGSGAAASIVLVTGADARLGRTHGRLLPSAPFPRDVATSPDGSWALVTEFAGAAVAVVPAARQLSRSPTSTR